MHEFAYFATLTYEPEFLPDGATLVPSHLSAFLKRLRRRLEYLFPGARMRFSACGEYGTEGRRPHFHVMLFLGSTALPDLYPWRRSDAGELLYRSTLVEEAWGMGHVELGSVTPASCDYVSKYSLKRITGDRALEYLRRFDGETGETWQVAPEFSRHSTRPGIGAPWFLKWHCDVVSVDGKAGIVLAGGERRSVPGYFLRLLKRSSERVASGKPALPGLEGLEGIEDIVSLARSEDAAERAVADLRKVSGDRRLLAAMMERDRERVAEYRSVLVSGQKETL